MKNIIFLVSIVVLLSGCTNSYVSLDEINHNLSSSNPSVVGSYISGIYNDGFNEIGITEDILENDNVTNNEVISQCREWLLPQYDKMIQELSSAKYQKIDDINDDVDVLMVIENKESGYKLYIYKDNKIKVVDGDNSVCYQADTDLEYTNSLLVDFAANINDFIAKVDNDIANKELIAQKSENAPLCEKDGTKTVYYEEKIGDSYSSSEGCRHHTFGTDNVKYQEYLTFYQCPKCGAKLAEETSVVEVDVECFGH